MGENIGNPDSWRRPGLRDVARFHFETAKQIGGVLSTAENIRQIAFGLASVFWYPFVQFVGWLWPGMNELLKLAPNWLALAMPLIGLTAFACWVWMKATYIRFEELRQRCSLLEQDSKSAEAKLEDVHVQLLVSGEEIKRLQPAKELA